VTETPVTPTTTPTANDDDDDDDDDDTGDDDDDDDTGSGDDDDDSSVTTEIIRDNGSGGEGSTIEYPGVAAAHPEGQPGVLSSAPNQPRPGVAAAVPPVAGVNPGPGVAAARPTPSVLPFAGQAGTGTLAAVLGGLGLASLGAALHLRARRKAAEESLVGEGPGHGHGHADGQVEGQMSDLPLDEDLR
jgi:hypothetical protein